MVWQQLFSGFPVGRFPNRLKTRIGSVRPASEREVLVDRREKPEGSTHGESVG
jgi:hypothetical protein